MIILDTDHISILQWEGETAERLRERLSLSKDGWLGTTAITLEEQTRAAITRLGQARSTHAQVKYYSLLSSLFRFFSSWRVAPFDDAAATIFDDLRKRTVNIGSSDLKIASIALAADAIALTANLRDFQRVPALKIENWTS